MFNLKPLQCEFYGLDSFVIGKFGVFPGSYNFIHQGHIKIAEHVRSLGMTPLLEISISNVDKQVENNISDRIFSIIEAGFPCVLTNAPTFTTKLKTLETSLGPRSSMDFVVGVDTWNRIFDQKYYRNIDIMDRSLNQLRHTNFHVFPRLGIQPYQDNKYKIKSTFYKDFIPVDISSTQIRELNGK